MSLPREPRQKMINMMYLVLTALLALNVSSEILNAFKTVNNSLQTTNATVDASTQTILKSLGDKRSDPNSKVRADEWFPHAEAIHKASDDVFNYIQGLKNTILTQAGGDPNDPTKKFKEDNLDIATHVLVEKGEGKKLLQMLTDYKKKVLGEHPDINKEFANSLQIDLATPPTTHKGNNSWEAAYFRMVPTVASMTILSKFQNDVRTSENKLVAYCHQKVGEVKVIFDSYEPIVGQSSSYFMPGQEITVNAGLGAFSSQNKPQIFINGSSVPVDDKGKANFTAPVGGLGNHTMNVTVKYTDQNGEQKEKTVPVQYVVGQASASIALDKMNVLYIGVPNPVTVSASGGGADKTTITCNNGTVQSNGGGKFTIFPGAVNDNTVITVNVDGKVAGQSQFRVRTIPDAQAYVGGKQSGSSMTAGEFKAQGGVGAGIKNFPFQLDYEVVSFTFTCDTDEDIVSVNGQGAAFAGAVRTAINTHVKPDRMVTIENIKVKGPDGRISSSPSLIYYIR